MSASLVEGPPRPVCNYRDYLLSVACVSGLRVCLCQMVPKCPCISCVFMEACTLGTCLGFFCGYDCWFYEFWHASALFT